MSELVLKNLRVLIIDDDSQVRNFIRSTLVQYQCNRIEHANTATEGQTKYQQLRPDIVFLDINLPDRDGLSLLEDILAQDQMARIIMISGNSTVENVKTAIDKGAQGFIVKPFSMKKIVDTIQAVFSRRSKTA